MHYIYIYNYIIILHSYIYIYMHYMHYISDLCWPKKTRHQDPSRAPRFVTPVASRWNWSTAVSPERRKSSWTESWRCRPPPNSCPGVMNIQTARPRSSWTQRHGLFLGWETTGILFFFCVDHLEVFLKWVYSTWVPLNHPLMDFFQQINHPFRGKAPFLLWSPGPIQGEWATFAEMQRAREILAALHCPGSGS